MSGTRSEGTTTKKVGIINPFYKPMLTSPVERRRRETINEGINELAKIVPGCEKNKGSILQRAVQFITQLKENEQQNITELSGSCDKFKTECHRAWEEVNIWKRACENAGITPDEIKERQENGEESGPSSSSMS
jgi:hypothetical protein